MASGRNSLLSTGHRSWPSTGTATKLPAPIDREAASAPVAERPSHHAHRRPSGLGRINHDGAAHLDAHARSLNSFALTGADGVAMGLPLESVSCTAWSGTMPALAPLPGASVNRTVVTLRREARPTPDVADLGRRLFDPFGRGLVRCIRDRTTRRKPHMWSTVRRRLGPWPRSSRPSSAGTRWLPKCGERVRID